MTEEVNAACRLSFDSFAHKAFTVFEPGSAYEWNWHIGCIADHLEAAYRGELTRLIINMPPRFLKSFLVSVCFPAWVLGKNPTQRFIMASFGFALSKRQVTACRRILKSPWYQQCFPSVKIRRDQDEKHHFETTENGMYYSSAIQSVTGTGGDYVMVDDPINPKEAGSDTLRANAITEIRGTLMSRFNDRRTGRFIMIMQRLHEADPTGDLLADGVYHHLKLPAEAKKPVLITLGDKFWTMKPGELLFPARFSRETLDEIRRDMGEYNYAGQMLQEPVPIGGQEFRDNWVLRYTNGTLRPKTMNIYILVDPAGGEELNKKKKKTSDWSAFIVIGLGTDKNYYLLDIVRDRLGPTERVDTLFDLHRKWSDLGGKPPKVGYEKYGMMTDTHYIRVKQDETNYRFPLVELGGHMIKEERIRRLIPDMQNGRWYFPDSLMYTDKYGRTFDLTKEIIKGEMPMFPRARFDDMLDAMSRIYDTDTLNPVWPMPQKSKVEKAYIQNSAPRESWEDF